MDGALAIELQTVLRIEIDADSGALGTVSLRSLNLSEREPILPVAISQQATVQEGGAVAFNPEQGAAAFERLSESLPLHIETDFQPSGAQAEALSSDPPATDRLIAVRRDP